MYIHNYSVTVCEGRRLKAMPGGEEEELGVVGVLHKLLNPVSVPAVGRSIVQVNYGCKVIK